MKKQLIFLAMLLFSLFSYSQELGDNVIVLTNTTMEQVKKQVLMELYPVEFSTETSFSTQYIPLAGSIYAYNLKISINAIQVEQEIMIYANYSLELSGQHFSGRAEYSKRQLIGSRITFDEMCRVFKDFENKKYIRK